MIVVTNTRVDLGKYISAQVKVSKHYKMFPYLQQNHKVWSGSHIVFNFCQSYIKRILAWRYKISGIFEAKYLATNMPLDRPQHTVFQIESVWNGKKCNVGFLRMYMMDCQYPDRPFNHIWQFMFLDTS